MRTALRLTPLAGLMLIATTPAIAATPILQPTQRIVFLGDSITHAGGYIEFIEAYLALREPAATYDIVNLGLPSETVSGLSEPYHPFPRPDVHERLDRALDKLKPDVVVACYGMNDGVYHPFAEDRFKAYQAGIDKLVADCTAIGARVILVTPPPFDAKANPKATRPNPDGSTGLSRTFGFKSIYERYDAEVIARYAAWIMERGKRDDVLVAVDIHTPINAHLTKMRADKPGYKMSGDGVHVDREGHRQIALALLAGLGYEGVDLSDAAMAPVMPLVSRRHVLLRDAWVSAVGHKRPGMKAGKPIDEARAEAAVLTAEIQEAAREAKP